MGVLKDINIGFAPPERLKTSEWAEKYFQLPPTSAEPGNWYRDRRPPQQGIMDAPFEKGINKVTLMCSAQIGKTTIGNATITRFILKARLPNSGIRFQMMLHYIAFKHSTRSAIASRFLSYRDRAVPASVIANIAQFQTKAIAISTPYLPKCDRINLSQRSNEGKLSS